MNKQEILLEEWIDNMVLEMTSGVGWVAEMRMAPNSLECERLGTLVLLATENIALIEEQMADYA